ncbi:MAG: YggT family protein [Lactobacillales bacterium]|jgi:YggT family protein|nr:YggT family protein [Lactobacillales bacterium]
MNYFIFRLLNLIAQLVSIYSVALVIYALLSWFPGAYQSKLGQIIVKITRPYLELFERLPLSIGGIDFSVLVALFVLQLADRGLNTIVSMLLY